MSDTVIKVENISKLYRLGEVGTGTLSHDLNRWWHKVRGKEDPYLKIGQSNDRTVKGDSDYAWALKDVSFEVKRGEVLGIIGRNGAGKSTLLKILSRVTTPTSGEIKLKGRVASLLEVGTGFNPELTGRDNIYLNGAILGMRKWEINQKFDEIVAFSGVERYVDTPVKRYSSGMYVRLAFAVAAHLEPEILIVDEVLAVGDAEFQKKCLGKMQDVAGHGRTILFVSHNMDAVLGLCDRSILLSQGGISFEGCSKTAISKYFHTHGRTIMPGKVLNLDAVTRSGSGHARFQQLQIVPLNGDNFYPEIGMKFNLMLKAGADATVESLAIAFFSENNVKVLNLDIFNKGVKLSLNCGINSVTITVDRVLLTPGSYRLMLWLANLSLGEVIDCIENAAELVIESATDSSLTSHPGRGGHLYIDFDIVPPALL